MKLLKTIKPDKSEWQLHLIHNEFFIYDFECLMSIDGSKKIEYQKPNRAYIRSNLIIMCYIGKAEILNQNLEVVCTLNSQDIVSSDAVQVINKHLILINNFRDNRSVSIYKNDVFLKRITNFSGKFLNENFRINYQAHELGDTQHFSCSDLLGEQVYWEYKVENENRIALDFTIWNDYLLFIEKNKNSGFKPEEPKLVIKHLITGELYWEVDLITSNYIHNRPENQLVVMYKNTDTPIRYQILDLVNKINETGEIQPEVELSYLFDVRCGLYHTIHKNKYYFSESDFATRGDKKIKPAHIGCFDIQTRKLDFIQTIPRKKALKFSGIRVNDENLCIMNSSGEVMVFELDR
jgi:hypothetical protein